MKNINVSFKNVATKTNHVKGMNQRKRKIGVIPVAQTQKNTFYTILNVIKTLELIKLTWLLLKVIMEKIHLRKYK